MQIIKIFLISLCFLTQLNAQVEHLDVFSKCYVFENNKNYSEAIAVLTNVYQSNSYSMNLRLGWLHYLNLNYSKSVDYYNQAISLQPKSIEARLGLAYPLSAQGKWAELSNLYEDALKIDPNHSIINYRMALIYYYNKAFKTAKKYVSKVVALYPFDYDAQLLLAKIEISQGNIIEAKTALQSCLQYNPSSTEALDLWKKVK